MPKIAISNASKVRSIVQQYPKEFSITPRNQLICQLCEVLVKYDKSFFVESHRKSLKHKMKNQCEPKSTQSFVSPKNEFALEFTKAFLSADIPLHKLEHQAIRSLILKMGHPCPSESACRLHVPGLAEIEKSKIKSCVAKSKIFLIIDETDISGKNYVNILVGDLTNPSKTYLYICKRIEAHIDNQMVCHLVDDVIRELEVERFNFLLLLSDAASYMTLAGQVLKTMYPHLFHVTCVAHLLHNCCMMLKAKYQATDNLIASIKCATVKNKDRCKLFSPIGLPPKPVVTRWGTWVSAAFWYSQNLPTVREIVDSFENDGIIVSRAKEAVSSEELHSQLIELQNYRPLMSLLEKCESSEFTIREAFQGLSDFEFGSDPANIKSYIRRRLTKNDIGNVMHCSRSEVSPADYFLLQAAQSTSCAVERSFSILKAMLRPNRNFAAENISNYAIMHYNNSN